MALNRRNCTTSTLVQNSSKFITGIRMIKAHFVVVKAIRGTSGEVKKSHPRTKDISYLVDF